jgi:hypothetical protein
LCRLPAVALAGAGLDFARQSGQRPQ